jgi:hypothetical protein
MKFKDIHIFKDARFSIGVEEQSGKYYLSIPVANSLVDYEEFYEISSTEFEVFTTDAASAEKFVLQCRMRKQDNRLMIQPGRDRGAAL